MTQRSVAPPHSTPLPFLLALSLPLLCNLLHGSLLPCVDAAPEVGGTPWATPALEALDEQHDAEILQSVITSMAQWKQKHTHKKYQREKRASESVVCYDGVGCFRDAGPFSYLDMLPSPPEEVSTQFLLYSRHRPHGPALLVPFTNLTTVTYSTSSSFSSVSSSPSNSERRSGFARPVRDSPIKDTNGTSSKNPPSQKLPSFSTSFSSPSSSDLVPSTAFTPADWIEAGLNVSAPTKVIVHGFGSSCSNVWVFEMRSALMSVEECNVICVDWEAGATIPNYVRAAANTRLVGKQLALLLGRLRDSLGLDLQRVHLIGFSLGAHVAGFAGSELQNLSRITGLDPAGPLFENQDPAARLDSSDATFVDVIHSNGENLILGGLGSWQPMGHVDFYPNGGRMQKGCSNLFVGAVSDIFWSSSESHGRSLCNHRRAYKFFTDSVSSRCHFPAIPCESYEKFLEGDCFPCSSQNRCGNMGYYADRSNGRGTLYLITRDDEPFCAHQYLAKVESTPSALPVISYGRIQLTILGSVPEANETFTLTHKDDEELKAGGSLSRIVVPHPVMEEPIKVEILYKAYSGWISSGLARWSIDKVTILDSFGKSASFCKKGLILESNVPVMLPLYPGECNIPVEVPVYSPSVPIPLPPIPILTNTQLDSSDSRPLQDNWPQTANDNEVKGPNKGEGSSPAHSHDATRIPTQVVYVGDEGLESIPEETPESSEEKDEKKESASKPPVIEEWEVKKNVSKSEALIGGIGAGQEDPLLSPQIHSGNDGSSDETDGSWQPLTNDGSSNSLSPDGLGSREEGARAFVDPGEVTNNINKRNDSLQPSSKDTDSDKQNSQSKHSSPMIHSHWRPRHIPVYGSSLYEPRGGWHPEMSPPELDPPPIHAPLTWQHWVGYDEAFLKEESREFPSSTSQILNKTEVTTTTTSTMKLTSTPTPTNSTTTTTETSGGPFAPVVETVQLLPQRLAAFLARAEEYARVTLSGMVLNVGGGTSPTGSGNSTVNDSSEAARRKPKYFPPMSSGRVSPSEDPTSAIGASVNGSPKDVQPTAIVVPSQATSVSAMGRGLPQYYPRAIIGRGSEKSLDTKSVVSTNYGDKEKSSQETKSSHSGNFGNSDMSEVMLGDGPQLIRKSDSSNIQPVVRPQRGISMSATERMLDVSVGGKGGVFQRWQKLDVAESHHQPRYIPLRRLSFSQESSRSFTRRNPLPTALVMPRKR